MFDLQIFSESVLHRDERETDQKAKFLIMAVRFLEERALLPEKLSSSGRDKWKTYMENLRLADLVEFAVRDLSKTYPHLTAFLSDYPDDFYEFRTLDDEALRSFLKELDDCQLAELEPAELYSIGATLLLDAAQKPKSPNVDKLSNLPLDRNSRVVELPNGMGYPTLELLSLYPDLTISQSCQIFVSSEIAETLAGWAAVLCGATEDDNERIVVLDENKWLGFPQDTAELVLRSNSPKWIIFDSIERIFDQARIIEL